VCKREFAKDHRLQIAIQEFLRHPRGFIDVTAADAERAIDDGRIVEDEGFLRGWRAVGIQNFDVRFEKPPCQLSGDWQSWRSSNEIAARVRKKRRCAAAGADIAEMAAENAR